MPIELERVVIFDGVCKLCAHSVTFILAHERDQMIRFAAAQSPAGGELLRELGFDPNAVKTFVFVKGGKVFVRSDAALEIARHLRGPWRLLVVLRVIPRVLRDWFYDLVARNRYRWVGRLDSCVVPTPELRARFIDG